MESLASLLSSPLLHLSPFHSQSFNSSLPLPLHLPRQSRNLRLRSHFTFFSASSPSVPLPEIETADVPDERFDWYSQWYPVAPVCDLDKRKPHARRILGLDVVVWWDPGQNRWQVFDDRCPHRLAPLSEGRIDKWGRLQCVYHGWCFDGAGNCKLIPQAPPDGPQVHTYKKACAAVYPSTEQNRIVWFWPSTDPQYKDILMKEKPPYIPQLDDPSYTSSMGTRDLFYGYEVLAENLMDPAHVSYAHYGLMRVPRSKGFIPRYVLKHILYREGGRPLEITIENFGKAGFLSRQELGYAKFVAPCLYYAVATLGSAHKSVSAQKKEEASQARAALDIKSFLLVFYCVPVSPGRSRVIFATPRNFSVWVDRLVPRWILHVGQNLILDSDLYLLHVEEHKIADLGSSNWLKSCYVPTNSDAKVVAFRKWLRKYSDNRVDWGTKFDGRIPPSPPKEQMMDKYWSHTVQCRSCWAALQGLKAVEVFLQVLSVASIGILAAMKQNIISTITRSAIVSVAVLCFVASKWLSHFIYKNFYFHDYDHAFK